MLMNNNEYLTVINDIKGKIKSVQYRVAVAINADRIIHFWKLGTIINKYSSWGNKFLENLARDIKLDFPNATGYSVRNLKYMAKFARTYPEIEVVEKIATQLSWSHNTLLLDKVKNEDERVWYAQQSIENGWGLDILDDQIDYQLPESVTISLYRAASHLCRNESA